MAKKKTEETPKSKSEDQVDIENAAIAKRCLTVVGWNTATDSQALRFVKAMRREGVKIG